MMRALPTAEKRKMGIHLSLDPDTLGRLDSVATEVGLSRSQLLREMIEELLERQDEKRWLAEAAAQELADEDEVSLEDVERKYGLCRTE